MDLASIKEEFLLMERSIPAKSSRLNPLPTLDGGKHNASLLAKST